MGKYAYYAASKAGKLKEVKSRAIEERIREKYSVSDELALLRQRYDKYEEFAEYNAFVEQIKEDVEAEAAKDIESHETETRGELQ